MKDLIANRVKEFSEYTVGIHIRRTDNLRSIQHSPSEWFIQKMKEELLEHPEAKFYVASDSLEEKQRLYSIFGDKIIAVWKETERSSKQGIIDALVELYALSATEKIYGSIGSSYSVMASRIGNIPLDLT